MSPIGYHCRQRGLGLLGALAALALSGLVLAGVIRVAPIWLEHWSLRQVLDGLADEAPPVEEARQLRLLILRRLAINDIRHVRAQDVEILPRERVWQVRIRYRAEAPLGETWSLLARFDEHVEIPRTAP